MAADRVPVAGIDELWLLLLADAADLARAACLEGAARRRVGGAWRIALQAGAVGIGGGYVVGVLMIGVDSGAFWSQMQGGVDVWRDVGNGVIKSVVFGFAVTFIALFQGYEAQPTPEGVSRATTKTVVYGSLAVLGLDFLLTALMFS